MHLTRGHRVQRPLTCVSLAGPTLQSPVSFLGCDAIQEVME
jgi:hypothetical protein